MAEQAIVSDPGGMTGTPCCRGTRVPFWNLIDYLEAGQSVGEFLRQFPPVTRELAVQALEEAKESLFARIAWRFCWTGVRHWISGTAFPATTPIGAKEQ